MAKLSPRRILIRCSWQTINIGDVAHAPALISVIYKHEPEANITLWPIKLDEREETMIRAALPRLQWVQGQVDGDGECTTPELATAWENSDVLVHGPGAGAFRHHEIMTWHQRTGKPHGYMGISVDPVCPPSTGTLSELATMVDAIPPGFYDQDERVPLDRAEFVFARDSLTLKYLQSQGIAASVLDFGPDATFAFDCGDREAYERFLADMQVEPGEYACFVPRLRYAPYAKIRNEKLTREDIRRDAINAATVQSDLQVLADAIAAWVRYTGQPAVVVPEMSYAVELAQEELAKLLPDDVVSKVRILDRYWPVEEAYSVYETARAVVSMDCHSPILASVHATPTLYVRQPSETVKGQMYADFQAPETVFEINDARPGGIGAVIESMVDDEALWRKRSAGLNANARARLTEALPVLLYGKQARELGTQESSVENFHLDQSNYPPLETKCTLD